MVKYFGLPDSDHAASNIVCNVCSSASGLPLSSTLNSLAFPWHSSTVHLFWTPLHSEKRKVIITESVLRTETVQGKNTTTSSSYVKELTLKAPNKNFRDILIFYFHLSKKNKAWIFMWIFCLEDSLKYFVLFSLKNNEKYWWTLSAAGVIGA